MMELGLGKEALVDSPSNKQGEGEIYEGSTPVGEVKTYSCLSNIDY
jgi:hypothetical protein